MFKMQLLTVSVNYLQVVKLNLSVLFQNSLLETLDYIPRAIALLISYI
jgi:hypothetical protein